MSLSRRPKKPRLPLKEAWKKRDTVSFGTIQRFAPSKIGGGSVEWLTLIWNRGRFELLSGGSKTLS